MAEDFREEDAGEYHPRVKTYQQARRLAGLPSEYGAANLQSRGDLAFCLDRARMMFGFYRRDEANDPETYASGVAAILSDYPRSIIEYVTDARTGIPSKLKWPPSPAEVKEACEAELARMRRMQQPASRVRRSTYEAPDRRPGFFARIKIHPEAPQFKRLDAFVRSGEADPLHWTRMDGDLFVSLTMLDNLRETRSAGTQIGAVIPAFEDDLAKYRPKPATEFFPDELLNEDPIR